MQLISIDENEEDLSENDRSSHASRSRQETTKLSNKVNWEDVDQDDESFHYSSGGEDTEYK